jgi:uncharacterized protein (TIRG00374 family)
MNKPVSRWIAYIPHAAIAAFFLVCFLLFQGDLRKVDLRALPQAYGVYASVLALAFSGYVIRAVRWRMYLKQLGYDFPPLFGVLTYIAGFAYTLAPGKVGELMKATYYHRYGIPLSAVAAAFFVERLVDLGVVVCLALVFLGFQTKGYGTLLAIAGLCVPVVVLAIAVLDAEQLRRIVRVPFVRNLRLDAIAGAILNATLSAKQLLTLRRLAGGLLLGVLAWGAECMTLFVLAQIVPQTSIGFGDSIGIYAAAIVVGALSFLPGGLGTTEVLLVALLVGYGFAMSDALLLTLVCRLLTLWFAVGLGWTAVGLLRVSRQGRSP